MERAFYTERISKAGEWKLMEYQRQESGSLWNEWLENIKQLLELYKWRDKAGWVVWGIAGVFPTVILKLFLLWNKYTYCAFLEVMVFWVLMTAEISFYLARWFLKYLKFSLKLEWPMSWSQHSAPLWNYPATVTASSSQLSVKGHLYYPQQ